MSNRKEQTGLLSRHCEARKALRGAGPKQSPNIISAKIMLEIMLGDCFVAPRQKGFAASRNDGDEDPLALPG